MGDITKVFEVDSQSKGQITPNLNSNDIFDLDGKYISLIQILMKPSSGLLTEVAGSQEQAVHFVSCPIQL